MSEEREAWEQLEGEPNLWYGRFALYRLLGPKRSLRLAHRQEVTKSRQKPQYLPGSWHDASQQWNWRERAEAWDAARLEELEFEANQVLSEGLALMHERVKVLKKRADKLDKMLEKEKKPSSYMIEQWRGLLADIAEEMGERVKTTKQDITAQVDVSGAKELLLMKIQQLRDAQARQAQEGNDESH